MAKKHRSLYRRRQRARSRVWPVVLSALVITLVALAAVFGGDVVDYLHARGTQNQLQDMYRGSALASVLNSLMPSAQAEEATVQLPPPETAAIQEDFAQLYALNPHLAGWLTVGRDIDYPVVQYDNEFYLEHDFYGESDIGGALFINAANKLNPRDSILLIHGHNMRNGTMFGNLDDFREYSYLRKYPLVTFRTLYDPQDVYYVPIAAFDASMTPGAYGYFNIGRIRFEFDIPADESGMPRSSELDAYIREMRELSFWDSPVEADSTDEFISLVTCSYNNDDGRMVLVCRRLRDGESPESIRALF